MTFVEQVEPTDSLVLDSQAGVSLDDFEDAPQEQDAQPEAEVQQDEQPQGDDLRAKMLAALERLNQPPQVPAQYQQPQQQEPEWQDPAEKPENIQRLNELMEAASYSEDARKEFVRLTNQWQKERTDHAVQQAQRQWQAQQQASQQVPQLTAQAYEQVRTQPGYTDVSREDWDAAVRDVFGGNTEALSNAFHPQNPGAEQTRVMLADMALGRAFRAGRVGVKEKPAAPPAPRSAGRQPADAAPKTGKSWSNTKDVNDLLAAIQANPAQYAKKGSN